MEIFYRYKLSQTQSLTLRKCKPSLEAYSELSSQEMELTRMHQELEQNRALLQILLQNSQIQFKKCRHPPKEPGRLAQDVVLQSLVRMLTVIMVARTSAATLIRLKTWAMIGGTLWTTI